MKIFLRIIFGLLALLVLLYLAVLFFGTPILKSAIEKKLAYYPQDSISIGSLQLQIFPLGLEANKVRFSIHQPTDSLVQQYTGELSEIEVAGIDWWQALRHNSWEVSSTEIRKGYLSWRLTKHETADSVQQNTKSAADKASLLIEDLDVRRLDLELKRDSLRVHLQVTLAADSLGFNRSDSLKWGFARVAMHSADAFYEQVGGDYDLSYQTLDFDSGSETLNIEKLSLVPRLDTVEWNKKYPYRKPMIQQLEISQLTVEGLELNRLPEGLYAHKVLADSISLRLYNNHSRERPQKRKPLPSERIANIKLPISIDTFSITHSSLLYRYVTKIEETGLARLEGDQIKLKLYPLSNIGHSTAADLTIDFSMRMMQEASLYLKAHFVVGSPDHEFKVDVNLSPTSFTAFNPLVYPSTGIKFKQGYCEQLSAHMRGNDYRCDGELDMAYRDLEVEFPEDKREGLNLLGQAKEIGVNLLLVNTNNAMGSNTGNIAFERPPNLPFIAYWWRSLQSGLVAVLVRFKDNE